MTPTKEYRDKKIKQKTKESGFTKLGLDKDLIEALAKQDILEPTKVQEQVVPLILEGRDLLCMSETGSGKTVSFALPIINQLKGHGGARVLVVAPTRELAKQIAGEFRKFSRHKGLKTVTVYGGVSMHPQIEQIPEADVIVGTPGRLLDLHRQNYLKLDKVDHLVLDECDRMLDMGFIEDVESIIYATPEHRQVLLFSATISEQIRRMSGKYMKDPEYIRVQPHLVRGVLKQEYYVVPHNQKVSLLVHLLKSPTFKDQLTLVFCRTKRLADMVARTLRHEGINAEPLHGDLSQMRREKVVEQFSKQEVTVVVATDVAARGLHIDDIRYVFNYNIPEDTETFIHRVGRTARNGKPGDAIAFLDDEDFRLFDNIISHYEGEIEKKVAHGVRNVVVRKNDDSRGGSRNFRGRGGGDRRGPPRRSGGYGGSRGGGRTFSTGTSGASRPPPPKKDKRDYDRMALADLD